jgi:hypothetical protein
MKDQIPVMAKGATERAARHEKGGREVVVEVDERQFFPAREIHGL